MVKIDPFKLFWKSIAGLERVLGTEFYKEWWDGKGEVRIGGTMYTFTADTKPTHVLVTNTLTEQQISVESTVEPLAIGDVLEFMLETVV